MKIRIGLLVGASILAVASCIKPGAKLLNSKTGQASKSMAVETAVVSPISLGPTIVDERGVRWLPILLDYNGSPLEVFRLKIARGVVESEYRAFITERIALVQAELNRQCAEGGMP